METRSRKLRSCHFEIKSDHVQALIFADHSDSEEDVLDDEDIQFLGRFAGMLCKVSSVCDLLICWHLGEHQHCLMSVLMALIIMSFMLDKADVVFVRKTHVWPVQSVTRNYTKSAAYYIIQFRLSLLTNSNTIVLQLYWTKTVW